MVEDFSPLQQPLGSFSCLPTAIASILINHFHVSVSPGDVSDWCNEDPLGCVLDLAIDGLRHNGWLMQQLKIDPEAEMRAFVNDEDDPTPVIAIVKPGTQFATDHAVVVLGFEHIRDDIETVYFMDPMSGQIVSMYASEFMKYWDYAGQLAYCISD